MNILSLASTLSPIRRYLMAGALVIVLGIIAALGLQTLKASRLETKVATVTEERDDARRLAGEALAATAAISAEKAKSDNAAAASALVVQMLETAVTNQRSKIDDLEKQFGAQPVSDLTRAHLRSLRDRQSKRAAR